MRTLWVLEKFEALLVLFLLENVFEWIYRFAVFVVFCVAEGSF